MPDITGREPQLGGQKDDNSPMLGGTRRQIVSFWPHKMTEEVWPEYRMGDELRALRDLLIEHLGVPVVFFGDNERIDKDE